MLAIQSEPCHNTYIDKRNRKNEMATETYNNWNTPKAEAIMTEATFDNMATRFNVFAAVAAAKTMSVSLAVVKTWAKKHL
jgi:predicted metal-binding transcription factor (methanogenesis marker protein 9)